MGTMKRYIYLTSIMVTLPVLAILAMPVKAHAATAIADGFNNEIISDFEFTNKGSMSASDIQSFLNGKVSTCDTNGDKYIYDSANGDTVTRKVYSARRGASTPFTCLKDYSENGRSSAQIIYDTAQSYNINPMTILVTLEKEQSLVRDDWPWQWNFNRAMGMGCPESAGCDAARAGFTNQVESGSRLLMAVYNKSCGGPTYEFDYFNTFAGQYRVLDGKNTYVSNCATAALYQYTPHRPDSAYITAPDGNTYYGNYNFVNFYSSWFGLDGSYKNSLTIISPLTFNGNPYYTPAIGENIPATFTVRNDAGSKITLSSYSVGMKYGGGYRDFSYGSPVSLNPGEEKTLTVNYIFREKGDWYSWIKLAVNGNWFIPSNSSNVRRDYAFSTRLPSVNATWFLVPQSPAVGVSFTPELRLVNNEYSYVTLDSVGIANWLNWPQPNNRDFGFQSVTIPPRTEITVPFGAVTLKEAGKYRAWALYRVGNYWETLVHTTGYEDVVWMNTGQPNIRASWFLVPENMGSGTFTPEFRVINYESSPVTLDAVGIACWKDWPQPNMRDFGFQPMTLQPGEERTILFAPQTLTEPGRYRAWAPYSIGGNWYQMYHTTGFEDVAWINVY